MARDRALSMVGKGRYELGTGGRKPTNATPFSASRRGQPGNVWSDCSGFVAWALGYDRVQNLGLDTEVWYSCEEIIEDARNRGDMFDLVGGEVKVGDIIVYGPKGKMKWGHIGVVTKILPGFVRFSDDGWKYLEITHCSTGNGGVAVRTSNAKLWYDSFKKKNSVSRILRYRHFYGE